METDPRGGHRGGDRRDRIRHRKAAAQEDPIFLPLTVYRTGAYAPNGIPFANGSRDLLQMLMNRDGGINGVPLEWSECETRTTPPPAWNATSGSRAKAPRARR
jgi:hypothetical protein